MRPDARADWASRSAKAGFLFVGMLVSAATAAFTRDAEGSSKDRSIALSLSKG